MSITLVLAGHLLPLGPHRYGVNYASAASGMAIFFSLSGFLVTTLVWREPRPLSHFVVRRAARVVPLAWSAGLLALWYERAPGAAFVGLLSFTANLPPDQLTPLTAHFWSLYLEVQFYAAIGLLAALLGRKGLMALPLLCAIVTAARLVHEQRISIVTWFRADEVLVGGAMALVVLGQFGLPGQIARCLLARVPTTLALVVLVAVSHESAAVANYFRPYAAAVALGSAVLNPRSIAGRLGRWRPVQYVAAVSYALYVIHGIVGSTWFGAGGDVARYLKRPLLIAVVWPLSHWSTFVYERWFQIWARRWVERRTA